MMFDDLMFLGCAVLVYAFGWSTGENRASRKFREELSAIRSRMNLTVEHYDEAQKELMKEYTAAMKELEALRGCDGNR